MNYLIDTHAYIWYVENNIKLSKDELKHFLTNQNLKTSIHYF
jgi:PIN domain nuclease of toxin-antitoxin system